MCRALPREPLSPGLPSLSRSTPIILNVGMVHSSGTGDTTDVVGVGRRGGSEAGGSAALRLRELSEQSASIRKPRQAVGHRLPTAVTGERHEHRGRRHQPWSPVRQLDDHLVVLALRSAGQHRGRRLGQATVLCLGKRARGKVCHRGERAATEANPTGQLRAGVGPQPPAGPGPPGGTAWPAPQAVPRTSSPHRRPVPRPTAPRPVCQWAQRRHAHRVHGAPWTASLPTEQLPCSAPRRFTPRSFWRAQIVDG